MNAGTTTNGEKPKNGSFAVPLTTSVVIVLQTIGIAALQIHMAGVTLTMSKTQMRRIRMPNAGKYAISIRDLNWIS